MEKSILINNLKVNYRIAGSGPVILVLHGWGSSSDSWVDVMEILSGKGYKVICPDFPGFGKSRTPDSVWSVDDYMNWFNGFVHSQNLKNFYLLGHSFGGRIAIKFSINYPDMVKNLILCDSAGIKPKLGFKDTMIAYAAHIGNVIFSPHILERFKDGARNIFYSFLRHKDYVKADGVMKEIIKKIIDEDLLPRLSEIQTKTLVVWGKEDKLVPVKYSYIFKEQIKDSVLEFLEDVGHSPHVEAPDKLSDIIVSFLTS